jgi:hypothetical protein
LGKAVRQYGGSAWCIVWGWRVLPAAEKKESCGEDTTNFCVFQGFEEQKTTNFGLTAIGRLLQGFCPGETSPQAVCLSG